jgi:hypothetical protein
MARPHAAFHAPGPGAGQNKPLKLRPDDPRVVQAVLDHLRTMPFEELEAALAYRPSGYRPNGEGE